MVIMQSGGNGVQLPRRGQGFKDVSPAAAATRLWGNIRVKSRNV